MTTIAQIAAHVIIIRGYTDKPSHMTAYCIYANAQNERKDMSCWNKEQLEQMLEDVVNELDLSDQARLQPSPASDCSAVWSCPWCGCDETWFDRTISYLPDGTDDGMKTRCVQCGRATDDVPN